MNEYTILTALQAAIAADSELNLWSSENYEKLPTYYIGMNPENPPPPEHYPVVGLLPESVATGTDRDEAEVGVILMLGVEDENIDTEPGPGNLVEYLGVRRCIELRRLVLAAAQGADLDGGYLAAGEGEYDTLLEFPLFIIVQRIAVRRPYEFRDDRII